MKIHKPMYGPQPASRKIAGRQDSPQKAEFRQLLESHIQAKPPAATGEVAGSNQIDKINLSAPLRLQGLTITESTLHLLDSFGAALADTRIEAGALEPYAEALEEETAALVEVKNQLPADDPLAKILDRVAAMSYLEAAKYRRGDYSA